jgi:hypothetical protein
LCSYHAYACVLQTQINMDYLLDFTRICKLQDVEVRRSSRLCAQQKEDMSFLEYVNKWKQK